MLSFSAVCLVCQGRSDGAHFGAVEACRACAAFFRRSIVRQKTYACKMNGSCRIDHRVQKRPKGQGMARRDTSRESTASMEFNHRSRGKLPMVMSEEQGMPILRRLHTHHAQLKGIRKHVHNGGEIRAPRAASFHDVDGLNLRDAALIADFIHDAFPEMGALEIEQKAKVLFELFYPPYVILECAWLTAQSGNPDRFCLINGDYMDSKSIADFYGPLPVSDSKPSPDTMEAVKAYASSFRYFAENVAIPLARIGVDEYEFYALTTLCLWDYDQDGISPETRVVAESVRSKIIDELIFYYRYIRRYSDEAKRISSLILMLPPIQRMGKRIVEDMFVGRLFNICICSDTIYELISRRSKTL